MNTIKKILKNRKAFGAWELSIILAVVFTFIAANNYIAPRVSLEKENHRKIEHVKNSLINFYIKNGRLPCPAKDVSSITNAEHHVEARNPTPSASGNYWNFFDYFNYGACAVPTRGDMFVGIVPVKTLGIEESYAYDVYGNYITYMSMYTLNLDLYSKSLTPKRYTGLALFDTNPWRYHRTASMTPKARDVFMKGSVNLEPPYIPVAADASLPNNDTVFITTFTNDCPNTKNLIYAPYFYADFSNIQYIRLIGHACGLHTFNYKGTSMSNMAFFLISSGKNAFGAKTDSYNSTYSNTASTVANEAKNTDFSNGVNITYDPSKFDDIVLAQSVKEIAQKTGYAQCGISSMPGAVSTSGNFTKVFEHGYAIYYDKNIYKCHNGEWINAGPGCPSANRSVNGTGILVGELSYNGRGTCEYCQTAGSAPIGCCHQDDWPSAFFIPNIIIGGKGQDTPKDTDPNPLVAVVSPQERIKMTVQDTYGGTSVTSTYDVVPSQWFGHRLKAYFAFHGIFFDGDSGTDLQGTFATCKSGATGTNWHLDSCGCYAIIHKLGDHGDKCWVGDYGHDWTSMSRAGAVFIDSGGDGGQGVDPADNVVKCGFGGQAHRSNFFGSNLAHCYLNGVTVYGDSNGHAYIKPEFIEWNSEDPYPEVRVAGKCFGLRANYLHQDQGVKFIPPLTKFLLTKGAPNGVTTMGKFKTNSAGNLAVVDRMSVVGAP